MIHTTTPIRRVPIRSAIMLSLLALTACTAWGEAPRRASTRSRVITQGPQQTQTTTPDSAVERTSRKGFVIDRRPVKAINTFNGNLADPNGRQARWASDDDTAIAWLKSRLDLGYRDGFRRFVLILPSGVDRSIDPKTKRRVIMSASHWLPMSPARRARLAVFFPQWIADHPGVTLGYYAGFDIDPEPKDVDYVGHKIPKFDDTNDRQAMYDIMAPWIEQAGFTEIWWDYTSTFARRDQAVQLSQWLAKKGIHAGGEAVPIVLPKYNGKLDERYLRSMPWMALLSYFRQFDPDETWRVDPKTTEVFLGFRGGPKETPTDLELLNAFQRGFIPWVYADNLGAHVMKLWKQANGEGISFAPPSVSPTTQTPTNRRSRRANSRRVNN